MDRLHPEAAAATRTRGFPAAARAVPSVRGLQGGGVRRGSPRGWCRQLLVAAAVLVFLAVEPALLFGSARLCDESDERWLRRTLADPGFYVTEAAVLALVWDQIWDPVGAVTGLLGAAAPWFVLLLVHGGGRHRVAGRAVVLWAWRTAAPAPPGIPMYAG